MTEAQTQLQNSLTTTFLANLAFLSEYDNELYHRVDELSRMIGNNSYKEKYALEFLMEKGDFDIYDIVNDKYLYNKNPKKKNNDLIRNVQFNEKFSILDIAQYFTFKHQNKIDRKDRFDLEYLGQFNTLTLNDTWEYANVLDDFLENQTKKLQKIDKFIFLGTLLGRHIPSIGKKIDAKAYLILERNLEIFRLSLFVVDYTILANKGAIFSIMDSQRDEEKKIFDFLNINKLENYLLKFSTTNINIDEYVDNILTILNTITPIGYDYNRKIFSFINRTTKVWNSNYNILHFDKIKNNSDIFKNTPILYLAAGPSLDENIDWIKENQNRFCIVTIGAAYKKLLDNNIHIDLIVTLDEQYQILKDKQFDDETVSKISKDTIILASAITNEKILKRFNKKNLFIYEVFTSFHKNNISFDGFSVGEITLAILLQFNPKKIYLIGLDLALNQQTGDSHSLESNSGISKLNLFEEQNRETFDNRKSLIKVKGNLEKEVFTTPLFYNSIKSVESKILKRNKDIKIYNLSKHGAYFFDTIPTNIEEVKVEKMERIKFKNDKLKSFLIENSTQKLSLESQEIFKKEILFIQKDIKNIIMDINNSNFKTYNDFLDKIIILPSYLYENGFFIFYQVLVSYFEILIPYLSYHFNEKKLKNEKLKVKMIKEIFIKQIENMFDDYVLCLKRIVK